MRTGVLESSTFFASFETNVRLASYRGMVEHVLAKFKPARFTMTVLADELGLQEMDNPVDNGTILLPPAAAAAAASADDATTAAIAAAAPACYTCVTKSATSWGEDGEDYIGQMGNYVRRRERGAATAADA